MDHAAASLENMDNTDVTVYKFRDRLELLSFTDFYEGNFIDPVTLDTIGNMEFRDDENGMYSSSHWSEYFDKSVNETVLVNWLGKPIAGIQSLSQICTNFTANLAQLYPNVKL